MCVGECAPVHGMGWIVCESVCACMHVQEKEHTGCEESHGDQHYLQSPFCSSLNLIKGNSS